MQLNRNSISQLVLCFTFAHDQVGYWRGRVHWIPKQLLDGHKSIGMGLSTCYLTRNQTEGCDFSNTLWQEMRHGCATVLPKLNFNSWSINTRRILSQKGIKTIQPWRKVLEILSGNIKVFPGQLPNCKCRMLLSDAGQTSRCYPP